MYILENIWDFLFSFDRQNIVAILLLQPSIKYLNNCD